MLHRSFCVLFAFMKKETVEQQVSNLSPKRKGIRQELKNKERELLQVKEALRVSLDEMTKMKVLQGSLTQKTEVLEKDRDPLSLPVDQNEADTIGQMERPHQMEQSVKMKTIPDQHNMTDRLVVLQHLAAQLELQKKQLKRKNSQLENQNENLKRERHALRDTLRKVDEERLRFRKQLMEIKRFQKFAGTVEEDVLRRKVSELEDQIIQLRHLFTEAHQERVEFIQQSSQNSLSLLALHHNLTNSLTVVTQCPIPSVLESETQRLDCSLREEFQMCFSQP
ncbi:centrosome-associated protein CEP250-like isoform X1 [Takifugu flavidus]|uniref:centrosome-associated protein CEP250-like isoform X1 n=1 Tax=Takifugu flavidus TaxID=433684 RepID=UPI00254417F6|nr:centrosome-associated protein CEP250-like isoform X1 [Takifugu flavidus]